MTFALGEVAAELQAPAAAAGLTLTASDPGSDSAGQPTARMIVSLSTDPSKNQLLELGESFDARRPEFAAQLGQYFAELGQRLRNPRPDVNLTLLGLPLSFGKFAWPFHASTSGADTFIVHGEIRLETGGESLLHAKISASLTQTFAEVVVALEQPFAEGFIYNAVRKTLDQGQLELVKSGNRQPVPVTTRYYSSKQNRFIFNDADQAQRTEFMAAKVFWLSHVLGANMPVWIADPRDAQYLNTNADELKKTAESLAAEGLLALDEDGWASATDKLEAMTPQFEATIQEGLSFIKPTFNESMRSGQTNM